MLIRRLNKNKKWPFWIISIVIFILIIIFYKYYGYLIQINWTNKFGEIDYINMQGIIEKIDNIGYGEYFLKTNESKILLKNYPKNIENLIGDNVVIEGEVKKIENNQAMPNGRQVFIVKSLKDLNNNILIENDTYTFVDELLILNTKDDPSIVPYKLGDKIIIYYKGNPLINISTFGCSKISTLRNCKDMINGFELNENEYFDSYNGLIYYKIDESKWILFNDLFRAYYFEIEKDEILLNISSIIELINADYIRDNKKDLLNKTCEDLLNIDDINIVGREGSVLIVNVKGKTKKNKQSECKVGFDLMNERKLSS